MPENKKKILIAEDEKPIAKALELKLNHSGFAAQVVFNGQEALDKLKQESDFDLILIDLVMPVLDGFGLLEALREKNNQIPIIVLSNLSQEEDFKRAKELGAKDFFIKSNTPLSEVVDYVNRAFE